MKRLRPLITDAALAMRAFLPSDSPYYGCFSGGKDSLVLKHLAQQARIPVQWHTQVTTIEPPELTAYIKRRHPDVSRVLPARTFFQHLQTKGLPTRRLRWCCEVLKHRPTPNDRALLMGLRAAESYRRATTWQLATPLRPPRRGLVVAPLLEWDQRDIWDYIDHFSLPYCSLYDTGRTRVGCILCPLAGKQRFDDIRRWPATTGQFKKAACRWWTARVLAGNKAPTYTLFENFDQVWQWWLSDRPLPTSP